MTATSTKSKRRTTTILSVSVNRDMFLKILKPIAAMLPPKAITKLMGCIRLQASDFDAEECPASLSLLAGRSSESAFWTMAPETDEKIIAGTVCVSGRRLAEIVQATTGKIVTLESDGELLTISCGFAEFQLDCEDPEQFPPSLYVAEPVVSYGNVKAGALKTALQRVAWCADFEDGKLFCSGVWFDIRNLKHPDGDQQWALTLAASDTRRISAACAGELTLSPGAKRPEPPDRVIILPKLVVKELLALLPEGDNPVGVSASKGWLELHHATPTGGMRLRFHLLESKYPQFWKIIPEQDTSRAVVMNGNQAASLMRLMAPFTNGSVKLRFERLAVSKAGSCRANAIKSEVGEASHSIPIIVPDGWRNCEMSVNPVHWEMLCNLIGNDVFSVFVPEDVESPMRIEAAAGWLVCFSQMFAE